MKCSNCGNETDKGICSFCGYDTNKGEEIVKKIMEAIKKDSALKPEEIAKEVAKRTNQKIKTENTILKYFLNAVMFSKEAFGIIESLNNEMGKGGELIPFTLPTSHINPMKPKEIEDYINELLKKYCNK